MHHHGLPLLILLAIVLSGCGFDDHKNMLLLVRSGDAESQAIAEAYVDARNIDSKQILEIALSESVGRVEIDSQTYIREIALPLAEHLDQFDPTGEITHLVTTPGIPLRIGHCDRNSPRYPVDCASAAVDAALAQLARTEDAARSFHRVENPFFRSLDSFETFRRNNPRSSLRFLVARLAAGPSVEAVDGVPRALHDVITREAPDPEPDTQARPLWRVIAEAPSQSRPAAAALLLDPIAQQLPRFGHRACDPCADQDQAAIANGLVLQSHTSDLESVPALDYPGLVLRVDPIDIEPIGGGPSPLEDFLAKWQTLGAGVISTHLGEPSLAGVTRPTDQLIALAEGSTAIEAHFKSVPLLGGMNLFVGDPLLRLPDAFVSKLEVPDHDRDQIPDAEDNCRDDPNPNQLDTNGDGIGNLCDPDVDDDGDVDTSWGAIYPVDERGDLQSLLLTARNGPFDPNHDFDGDGKVDEQDLIRAQLWLFRSPGTPAPPPAAPPAAPRP